MAVHEPLGVEDIFQEVCWRHFKMDKFLLSITFTLIVMQDRVLKIKSILMEKVGDMGRLTLLFIAVCSGCVVLICNLTSSLWSVKGNMGVR
jgi:hypothetical protein